MAKLTKIQRRSIEQALAAAKRAHIYIHSDKLVIANKDRIPSTTLHFIPNGPLAAAISPALYCVEKHSSDIVGLETCLSTLYNMLELDDIKDR